MFSPDAARIVTVSDTDVVALWNRDELTEQFHCQGRNALFSPDGTLLATGNEDGTVSLWTMDTLTRLHQFQGGREISRLRFSRDSNRVLAASRAGLASVWEVETGSVLGTYAHQTPLLDAAFTHDETLVVACAQDNEFVVWDPNTNHVVNHLAGRGTALSNVTFSTDGTRMATATNEAFFQVWDPLHQTGRQLIGYAKSSSSWVAISEEAGLVAKRDRDTGLEVRALDGTPPVTYASNPLFFAGAKGTSFLCRRQADGCYSRLFRALGVGASRTRHLSSWWATKRRCKASGLILLGSARSRLPSTGRRASGTRSPDAP